MIWIDFISNRYLQAIRDRDILATSLQTSSFRLTEKESFEETFKRQKRTAVREMIIKQLESAAVDEKRSSKVGWRFEESFWQRPP